MINAILIVGFLSRLLPHDWNFTPVLALGLVAGAYLPKKRALLTLLGLMIMTDIFLGFYEGILVTWLAVLTSVGVGLILKKNRSFFAILGGSLIAAILFFVISNFGVWLIQYPKTWSGIVDCYTMALPFFRNSLISTCVYGVVLIRGIDLIQERYQVKVKVQT